MEIKGHETKCIKGKYIEEELWEKQQVLLKTHRENWDIYIHHMGTLIIGTDFEKQIKSNFCYI